MANLAKIVVVDRFLLHLGPYLGGRWSWLTVSHCSEVDLVLQLFGWDLGWSLLTGGCYSEAVVCSGLTVYVYIIN